MTTDRFTRLLPLSGVLFALTLVGGLTLTSGEPDNSATAGNIFSYWHGHYGRELVSSLLLIPFAIVFLLVFVVELRRAIHAREVEAPVYSPLMFAGGILVAAGLGVTGSLGAAVATAAHHGSGDSTYTLAQIQSYDWVPWMVGFAVLLIAGGLRTYAFPRWFAVATLIIGVVCLTPAGAFALFVLPVWAVAASVVLYRKSPSRSRNLRSSAASAA
jgi:hypothetical protein